MAILFVLKLGQCTSYCVYDVNADLELLYLHKSELFLLLHRNDWSIKAGEVHLTMKHISKNTILAASCEHVRAFYHMRPVWFQISLHINR